MPFKVAPPSSSSTRSTRRSANANTTSTSTTTTTARQSSSSSSTRSRRVSSNANISINRGRGGGRGRGRGAGARGKSRNSRSTLHSELEDDLDEVIVRRHEYIPEEDEEEDVNVYREEGGQMVGDIYIPPRHIRAEPQLSGERLVIQKIVCENFKSYGGLKTMGPFHKSFSSIIGPNGNGKSNIIDAMLFVFGYKASKIRCKKVSVLIHKSELLPDVRSCAVTVHFVKIFDNNDPAEDEGFNIVPGSEIRVKRRADASNNSSYYYNDKPVKFQQVAEFLKEAGIDIVHNRFLILQGEVEQIAQMPPKRKNQHETGLLEFLEEVIGTKRYLKCLSQLDEKVEDLNFQRESRLQYVDIVERERRDLMEPVKLAKEFLRKQNSLARFENTRFQIKVGELRLIGEEDRVGRGKVQEELNVINGRLGEINEISKERDGVYYSKEEKVKELELLKEKLKSQVAEAEAKFSKTHEQIQRSNTQRKKIMGEIVNLEKELEILELVPENHQKDLEELKGRKEELELKCSKEEKSIESSLSKLKINIEKVLKEKEAADQEFLKMKNIRDNKRAEYQKLEAELKLYKEKYINEQRKLEVLSEELKVLVERIQLKEREARGSMGGKVGGMQKRVGELESEIGVVNGELRGRKIHGDELHGKLESAKESMECSIGNDTVGKAFDMEKKGGRLSGLFGRFKDLATIDEKYNISATVSTSLWENWICDTDSTAEECINFLKSKRLPFQNFLCLNKLSHYDTSIQKPFHAPPNSKRIFDLLKFKMPPEVGIGRAYYKGLRNTLVVEDLDVAQPIAYNQGHRVATLRGDLIEPSGQMTGGGRERIIPKMNSSTALANRISPQEFNSLKTQCIEADKILETLSNRRNSLEQELNELRMNIREYEKKLNSSKSDIESIRNQIKLKENRINEQQLIVESCRIDDRVLLEKEKMVEKAEESLNNANGPCETAQEKSIEIEEKLKYLQLTQRKEITKKLDGLEEQKKKVVAEIDKLNVELKNYEKNHKKLVSKISNLKNEKEKLELKMRELNEVKIGLTKDGVEVNREVEEIQIKLNESKKELKELKKNLSQFSTEKIKLDKEKVELDNELGNYNEKLGRIDGKIKNYENLMRGIELVEVPDEEVEPFTEIGLEEIRKINLKELENKIHKLKSKLKNEQPNLGCLEQYKLKTKEFLEKVQELDKVTLERDKFREAYLRATQDRLSEFMEGFVIISTKLKEMFRMISMGGDAELELSDSTDPFSFGIEMCVRPARKTWKKISFLSGGEKTLSSLALVFALHHFKPSPFYVMDEIDAALDFKNVSIIANYIKDRTSFTQFIIISLRSNMFELADSMLGVYKVDNLSYSIHLGVGMLLNSLRERFRLSNRPFPFENDFLQNNRGERRKDLIKFQEKKNREEEEEEEEVNVVGGEHLFNANLSNIQHEETTVTVTVSEEGLINEQQSCSGSGEGIAGNQSGASGAIGGVGQQEQISPILPLTNGEVQSNMPNGVLHINNPAPIPSPTTIPSSSSTTNLRSKRSRSPALAAPCGGLETPNSTHDSILIGEVDDDTLISPKRSRLSSPERRTSTIATVNNSSLDLTPRGIREGEEED